ncbi:MAG: HU family DNA-binding protein [Alphaproteobacteria bacterium]|jgi:DNA-binding protein HU-beta|nr:HU family DNA-binding protein [Alphaproteobacteria bacterium]
MAKQAAALASKAPKNPKPAAGARGAKADTPATVTLRQIAAEIAETHGLARKQADGVLAGTVELMVRHLKKGDKVRIGGLGILQVKKRPARMGRNPATGEQIKIKASKRVAFRVAKDLKDAI